MFGYLLGGHSGPCFEDLPCERHAALDAALRKLLGPRCYSEFKTFVHNLDENRNVLPDPKLLAIPVTELETTPHARRKLQEDKLLTVGAIFEKGERYLRTRIPGLGKFHAEMTKRAIEGLGLILPP